MEGPRARRLHAVLLSHPAVVDCAVAERTPLAGPDAELVAYVVLASRVQGEVLKGFASEKAGVNPSGLTVVAVSALPLTADGDADLARLLRYEIADEALAAQWDAALPAVAEVGDVATLLHDHVPRVGRRHLWDLLPSERLVNAPGAGAVAPRSSHGDVTTEVEREAISDGGSLLAGHSGPQAIGDWLVRAAESGRGLIYVDADGNEERQSYRELLDEAERILSGLRRAGVSPGDRVLLQCVGLKQFLETFWGCVLGSIIPVPLAVPPRLDAASGALDSLRAACGVLDHPVIATDQAVEAMQNATAELNPAPRVLAIDDLRCDGPATHDCPDADAWALFMLTSGSTGTPKAVMLTHANLWSRTVASQQLNGFSSAEVSLNWMPLDHVAGLIYFHLRDVFVACQQVHIATAYILQEPLRWLDCLERYRATVTFAPNFAFGLVNDRLAAVGNRGWDLSSVRLVLNGAEAIVARTARRFLTLLQPHGLAPTALHPAWGMSETSSGVTYSDAFSLDRTTDADAFVEVGRPLPGLQLRIVGPDGLVVNEGAIGKLQVRGAMVTRGYYRSPELTRDAFTEDGWFITGDLGLLRDGRLTITGREKDVVIINSVNYHCHTIEGAIEELPGVEPSFTAACAVRREGANTDQLAVFFHSRLSDDQQLAQQLDDIRTTLTRRVGLAADYILAVATSEIPKTSLGKIQRPELSRRLLAGELDAALVRSDVLAGNGRTVPDWFFTPVWQKRRSRRSATPAAPDRVWLFADGSGLAHEIHRQLARHGTTCVIVEAGAGYRRESDVHAVVDPASAQDVATLVDDFARTGPLPSGIVHLWGYGPYRGEAQLSDLESAQHAGALSVIRLVRALAAAGAATETRLLVVGTHHQRVLPDDVVAYEKAPVLGVVSSLPQEHSWLECRHVDVDGGDLAETAAIVRHELCAWDHDRLVAYRQGERYRRSLQRAAFSAAERQPHLFRSDGFYLVTGGTGGIGERVCAMIADRFQPHLLIVGRGAEDGRIATQVAQLRRSGGEAAYAAVDVCDEQALANLVADHEARWQRPLCGAIHLAGVYDESPLIEQDDTRFLEILRPKTAGTVALQRLMASRPGGFIVSSSSVAGFFGGANIGSYAAANAFQEAFAAHYQQRGPVDHYCFSWSNWDGVGQSRDHQLKDAVAARGYLPIVPELGLRSFLIGTAFRAPLLLVGLDRTHRFVRRHLGDESAPLERLTVFYTADRALSSLPSLDLHDRFGTLSRPEGVCLPEMPRDADGRIDRARLAAYWGAAGRRATTPRTDVERRLADLWAATLSVSEVSLDDSFFAAGGDSLHALRLLGRIRDAFGVGLPVRAIFDAGTLQDLARVIEQHEANGVVSPAAGSIDSAAVPRASELDDLSEEEIDRLLRQLDVRPEPARGSDPIRP